MNKYAIQIKEVLTKTVIVESDSFSNAVDKVEAAYNNGEVSLDCENIERKEFGSTQVFGESPIDASDERLKLFDKI